MKKIGRNEACYCGSGKKYKKCCNDLVKKISDLSTSSQENFETKIMNNSELDKANKLIREKQQGLGKPIIWERVGDYQTVRVDNKIYSSKEWRTFPDFLFHYMKEVLTKKWFELERTKPLDQQHPIIEWQNKCYDYLKKRAEGKGKISWAPLSGAAACYCGLAYSIYLLEHNVGSENPEVRVRIDRLKNKKQFQGAYYELIIMNCFIRAGFEITLIKDTSNKGPKCCEFDAISKKTKERYTVEARMKAVSGYLGKDQFDGSPKDSYLLSPLENQLKEALQKPASGKRMIFLGLNTDSEIKNLVEDAAKKLVEKEKDLIDQESAYVFVTNIAYHRNLDSINNRSIASANGFKINDFVKPGISLSERLKREQKYKDVGQILEAFRSYTDIPQTFDGSIPCYAFNKKLQRIVVGKTYFFEGIVDGGIKGIVTAVSVDKTEKILHVEIDTGMSQSTKVERKMSEDELRDYEQYGDSFFASPRPTSIKNIEDPYELFKFCYEECKNIPKEKLLELMKRDPFINDLRKMDQDELVMLYCESAVKKIFSKAENKK